MPEKFYVSLKEELPSISDITIEKESGRRIAPGFLQAVAIALD